MRASISLVNTEPSFTNKIVADSCEMVKELCSLLGPSQAELLLTYGPTNDEQALI